MTTLLLIFMLILNIASALVNFEDGHLLNLCIGVVNSYAVLVLLLVLIVR